MPSGDEPGRLPAGVEELSEVQSDTTQVPLPSDRTRGRRVRRLLIPVLVGLALAACGDAADPPSAAAPAASATTAAATTIAATPRTTVATTISALPAASFPVTVTAANGAVTVAARPERVVSLSATHTEMLYAIGADGQIAGTDLTSNYPPAANETAKIDAFNFDVEEVAELDPDLAVLAFDFGGEVEALDAIGVPTILLPPPVTIDDALEQLRLLGRAVGHGEAAAELAEAMDQEMEEVFAAAGGREGLTFFHEVDNTLFSPNSRTFLGEIYSRFGLSNVADEVPDEFASGYVQLSPEYLLEADPDFIFLGDAAFGESAATLAARPGWDRLSAVSDGRVVELDSEISGRWGPRTLDLVRQIGEALVAGAP